MIKGMANMPKGMSVSDIIPGKIDFTSTEALLILYPIMFIEIGGLLFLLVADDYGILDAVVGGIVWPWLFVKGGINPERAKKQMVVTLSEIVPIVGILPMWSWSVWKVLEEDYNKQQLAGGGGEEEEADEAEGGENEQ